jgi:DNA-binding MarR family transcriptional regulator
VIGMDKGSISRCLKGMQERGLIRTELDPTDGRLRIAVLTPEGRTLHDQIMGMALERERAFLSVLDGAETEQLLNMLRRLHENLPAVESATLDYAAQHFPKAKGASRRQAED